MKKFLIIIIHVAVWACFFLLPIVFFSRPRDPNFQVSDEMIQKFICIDAYLIAFYYFNRNLLIPKLLSKKKWFWYILAVTGCLLLFLLIPRLLENAIRLELPAAERMKISKRHHSLFYPFTGYSAVFFLVLTVSTCTRVIQEWLGIETKKQEIEKEKLSTELSFLKSQINPHFLFNTLNNIYSMAMVKSEATADAVLKLSSIMRYILTETKHDTVPLDKEIEFIRHFIELQKVRMTDKVSIGFAVEGNTESKEIAPLLLIPFVENAFKYGISTKEPSNIQFTLKAEAKSIHFTSQNHIVMLDIKNENNTGIGLKNTRRRLELLYPEKHTLEVVRHNDQFIVNLTITK